MFTSTPSTSTGSTSTTRKGARLALAGSIAALGIAAATATAAPAMAAPEQPNAGACPAKGTLTQDYGGNHDGIDIGNDYGTPILAADGGEVTHSGPASGYGNWIRIRHGDGSVSEYGHMQALHVPVGAQVQSGQHIADMGSEGQSTGPHLHFEVHLDGGFNYGDNPHDWLGARQISGCW